MVMVVRGGGGARDGSFMDLMDTDEAKRYEIIGNKEADIMRG